MVKKREPNKLQKLHAEIETFKRPVMDSSLIKEHSNQPIYARKHNIESVFDKRGNAAHGIDSSLTIQQRRAKHTKDIEAAMRGRG